MSSFFQQKRELQAGIEEIERTLSNLRGVAKRNATDNAVHMAFALLLCAPLCVAMGVLYTLHGAHWTSGMWYASAVLWMGTAWVRYRSFAAWMRLFVTPIGQASDDARGTP